MPRSPDHSGYSVRELADKTPFESFSQKVADSTENFSHDVPQPCQTPGALRKRPDIDLNVHFWIIFGPEGGETLLKMVKNGSFLEKCHLNPRALAS